MQISSILIFEYQYSSVAIFQVSHGNNMMDDNMGDSSAKNIADTANSTGELDQAQGNPKSVKAPKSGKSSRFAESSRFSKERLSATQQKWTQKWTQKRAQQKWTQQWTQWKWAIGGVVVAVFVCVLVVATNVVKVSYVSLSPGNVYSATGAIQVEGDTLQTFLPESEVGFVTVGVSRRLTLWQYFFDSLDDRIDIVEESLITGGRSREEDNELNVEHMRVSGRNATDIALEYLGHIRATLFPVFEMNAATRCVEDLPVPVDVLEFFGNAILPGTTVLSIDSMPVQDTEELVEYLSGGAEGSWQTRRMEVYSEKDGVVVVEAMTRLTQVTLPSDNSTQKQLLLEISPPGSGPDQAKPDQAELAQTTRTQTVNHTTPDSTTPDSGTPDSTTPDASPPECPELLGWAMLDRSDRQMAGSINLNSGGVSGPSAGLSFTLAVIDLLTPGDLLGDKRVAATGVIGAGGQVGPVGGVKQKTAAVINRGYDIFLVPESEFNTARAAAGDNLRVEKVNTLDEALAVLESLGGDPLSLE